MEQDDWALGSGLPLDGATVTITKAVFGLNAELDAKLNKQSPTVYCTMTFKNEETGEEADQEFSVGGGWDFSETGRTLTAIGTNQKINDNSVYGIWLKHALEAAKASGKIEELKAKVSPRNDASTWVGTRWTLVRKEMKGFTKDSTTSRIVPEQFLGFATDGKVAAKTNSKVLTAEDRQLLVEVAANFETHEAFQDAMFTQDEYKTLMRKPAVQAAVTEDGEGSVFHTAHVL